MNAHEKKSCAHEQIYPIDQLQLSRLLRALRRMHQETQNDVVKRIKNLPEGERKQRIFGGGIRWLERRGAGVIHRTQSDLDYIAKVYGFPKLMIDPLLSSRCTGPTAENFENFMPVGNYSGKGHYYGQDIKYSIPFQKLDNTEHVALVHLEIDPNGGSDSHSHPGTEIMWVLKGDIEVRLEATGLRLPVHRDEFVMFNSSQRHSAWNINKKQTKDKQTKDKQTKDKQTAKVFILRSYPLGSSETSPLQGKKRSGRRSSRTAEKSSPPAERFDMTAQSEDPEQVADRIGLGRLLEQVCSKAFRGDKGLSLQDLEDNAKEDLKYNKSKFDRLHHGQTPVAVKDLPKIAKLYDVHAMLLYDFAFPAVGDAFIVRDGDWRAVPDEFIYRDGVEYRVPCRRLADSDIGIEMLKLQPKASTPLNRHPGTEILLNLKGGDVSVKFGMTGLPVRKGEIAHYNSTEEHCVVNAGADKAKLLVIRSYGWTGRSVTQPLLAVGRHVD